MLYKIILAIVGYKLTRKDGLCNVAEKLGIDIAFTVLFIFKDEVCILERVCKVILEGLLADCILAG